MAEFSPSRTMNNVTDPRLQHYGVNLHSLQPNAYQSSIPPQLSPDLDPYANTDTFALNSLANASVNSSHSYPSQNNGFAQPRPPSQLPVQTRGRHQSRQNAGGPSSSGLANGSPQNHSQTYPTPPRTAWDTPSANSAQTNPSPQAMYVPALSLETQDRIARGNPLLDTPNTAGPSTPSKPGGTNNDNSPNGGGGGHFSGMKLVSDPPNLATWREKLFNVTEPILMSEEEYQTYFPHVDNVYSHRSTQKYKRKPFVSHYWDCRLKGRPPGTPKSNDPAKKKRKRNTRERDLCDVKIKITEYFPADEAGGSPGGGSHAASGSADGSTLTFIMESEGSAPLQPFGMLAPTSSLPPGHPGAHGARWYMIQRVNGNAGEKDEDGALDHKHTLEDSDKIKKNSVQRWMLKEEKEHKRAIQISVQSTKPTPATSTTASSPASLTLRASGLASQTAKRHLAPAANHITFYANSFCPFAQRVWIALEIKQIPYQYVEVVPKMFAPNRAEFCPPELLAVCPEGIIPCIRHGNWAVWESGVMLEYLEDLSIGHSLLPLIDNPQLRAHCRLWTDHINRKILPAFYALLLTPPVSATSDKQSEQPQSQPQGQQGQNLPMQQRLVDPTNNIPTQGPSLSDQHEILANTLTANITTLVDASHQTGPFFLGDTISFVDVTFAPWIIRLSRVLSHYRNFPRPEVGTRWRSWVDAVEADERVRATVSEEGSYHHVYNSVGEGGREALGKRKGMVEVEYARRVVREEGFGLGGDIWGVANARSVD